MQSCYIYFLTEERKLTALTRSLILRFLSSFSFTCYHFIFYLAISKYISVMFKIVYYALVLKFAINIGWNP